MEGDLKAIHDLVKDVPESVKALRVELDTVKKELADAKSLYASSRATDDRSDAEKQKDGVFSLGAMVRGIVLSKRENMDFASACIAYQPKGSKSWRDAGFSAAVVLEEKAMSTTAGSGGYFAPELWMTEWVNILAAKAVAYPLCEKLSGLSNADVRMGRLATGATGYWIGEGSQITISSPTDEQITVTPHEAAARVQVSNQLLKMSNPAIEGVLRTNLLDTVVRLVDLGILEGSGSANQPSGIKTSAGSTVTTSGAMTWAKLEEFLYDLAKENAPMGRVTWFMHPRTKSAIRQLTTSNYPQFVGTPTGMLLGKDFAGDQLLGFPVATSSQMTITGGGGGNEGVVLLADMSECIVADWGAPEFAVSDQIAFDYNSTQVRMIWLVDVALKHSKSFVKCTDTTS